MTDFSTRSMLEVVVDDRSLSDARDEIESELGSVRATLDSGRGGAGATGGVAALTDGGDGVRDLLETQTDHLEEIREAVEDMRGGGGGGTLAAGTGAVGAVASKAALGAGLGALLEAGIIGGLLSTEGDGPSPPSDTPPGEVQLSGVLRLTEALRDFASSPPSWLTDLPSLPSPQWLSELTSFAPSTPDWVRDLVGFDLETPGWVRDLTSVRFDEPGWLSRLTSFTLTAPSWLADLETLQLPTPQWVQDLTSIFNTTSNTDGDNNDRPDSFPGSDQRLFNEATRRRENTGGRTEVRNDITIEAVLNDLGDAQRIIERAVEQQLRNEVLN